MKRTRTLLLLWLTLAVAAVTVYLSLGRRSALLRQLEETNAALAASQANWQQVAADKEALEAQRDQVSSDLREAQTALAESREKIETLTAQIEELEEGNALLRQQLDSSADEGGIFP